MMGSQHKKRWKIIINLECWPKVPHSCPLPSPVLHLAKNMCGAQCSVTLAAAADAQCLCKWDPSISYETPNKGEHSSWLLVKRSSALPRTAQSLCCRNRSGGANCPPKNKNLHLPIGIGLITKATCRPFCFTFPASLAGVYPSISPLLHNPGSSYKGKRCMKGIACVLGEEMVCMPVEMHREQRIWAEIRQTAQALPKLECFLLNHLHSAYNASIARV